MAGILLGASSSIPEFFIDESSSKFKVVIPSFEKELGYILTSLKKGNKTVQDSGYDQLIQKCSNSIFNLWSAYETKLPSDYFAMQQLALGDLLCENGQYGLARTHCYGRYLKTHCDVTVSLLDIVSSMKDGESTVYLLRAMIGDAVCQYHALEKQDPRMMYMSTRNKVLKVLGQLQQVSQAALLREHHYWLAHNCLLLIFSISRSLMSYQHCGLVLEFLLWGVVCMESSVPLIATKYLPMRVNFYIAVCQCYLDLQQPHQAELFARRGLDKVHELAELENYSSAVPTESSELVYREASVKLGVIIFKRSVFLSRKKLKPGLRPKVRPSIKELLQLPSPRSPTEKLLSEMFNGPSAQFLAVLETLSDSSRRPLHKGPPTTPVGIELDQELVTDIYQELFCAGTDMVVQALEGFRTSSSVDQKTDSSLIESAVRSGLHIPLESVVQFVRLAYSCDQKEIVEMLAEGVIKETQVSESSVVKSKGKVLELLLMFDSLMALFKKYKTVLNSVPQAVSVSPNTGTTATTTGTSVPPTLSEIKEETNTTAEELFSKLQQALSLLHLMVADCNLLTMDFDLLLDSCVLLWEVARPAFSIINSHEHSSCRQFLGHPSGNQYLVFLTQLVEVFSTLELWRVDPLLYGELCLKLACLYEARAQLTTASNSRSCSQARPLGEEGGFIFVYDRSQLLECLGELDRAVRCIELAREHQTLEGSRRTGTTDLEVLHAEFVFAITRVRLKLASTIPPPCPSEGTQKLSSLKSKVAERKERQFQRAKLLSELTAPTVQVPSVAKLREGCRESHYKMAALLMLQASSDPQPDQATKQALMEESYTHLLKEARNTQTVHTTAPTKHTSSLPPPLLLHSTDTSMTFEPCPFPDSSLQDQISYYKLFGRVASGSNVKVRVADKHLPGLGLEVPAGDCTLTVHGLQSNEEYVFAVGAYSSSGQLVGGSIGQTGRPLLCTYSFPLLTAWGIFCKSAYISKAHSLAEKASEFLWKEFVLAEADPSPEGRPYQLNHIALTSTPASIVRQFVQSILIHTQLKLSQGGLFSDKLCTDGPLRPSQLARLSLARRLMLAIEVSAMLNDGSLCLQAVVMTCGVLAPLIQYNIQARPLVEMLLRCYAVISEIPENLQLNKQVTGLHHMIAGLGHFLGKVALQDNKRGLFSIVTDNARSLLIASMPVVLKQSEVHHLTTEGLHQASLLSGSHDPSLSSYATISSGLPSLLPQGGQAKKKKVRSKKLTASIDEISDESKSPEYKAFEGFLLSHHTHTANEDLDLTGQEDPMLLHAVIATQTSQTAYREVHKFRKRPQYLEFFVHLSSSTLSKGHVDRVMEWGKEAFLWLTRRNELLLSSKTFTTTTQGKHEGKGVDNRSTIKPPAKKTPRTMSRVMSTCGSSLKVASAKKPGNQLSHDMSRVVSSCGSSMNVVQFKRSKGVTRLGASLNAHRMLPLRKPKAPTAILAKLSPTKLRNLQPIVSTKVLDVSRDIKITRDDIETKAVLVMIGLLPIMWRKHKARKRLRSVCSLELPWRAQANLILATCHLELLQKRLYSLKKEVTQTNISGLTFDAVGTILDGVVPVCTKFLAGCVGNEPRDNDSSRHKEFSLPLLPVMLADIHQMMIHYRRAITLAHRGKHWILLQNTSRSLLNTITCLLQACSKDDEMKSLVAALYGEALLPLNSASNALIDLLLNSGVNVSGTSLPEASSLKFTAKLDECDCVGMLVVKRLVFLAVQVLYVHEHWEKVVSIIVKFDDITQHSWAEQLVPVLTSAQSKLSSRALKSKATVTREKLEPAAHLDPGPDGYNVYGKVGHSLGLVSVSLDRESSLKRLGHNACSGGELSHARRLLKSYLGGFQPVADDSSTLLSESSESGLDVGVLSNRTHISDVIKAYDHAIEKLAARGDLDLLAQAMNELGDLTLHTNKKSSSQWWGEALCVVLQTRDPLHNWRKNLDTFLSSAGLWGCLLSAGIAYKLARYGHYHELDIQLEYSLMCVSLYKTALSYSQPTPTSDLDFIDYRLSNESTVFPGVEVFSDEFRCSPLVVMASLSWACHELIARGHVVTVLPALCLYQYLAKTVCRDTHHAVRAKLLRFQAFTRLYKYEEALFALSDLLAGAGLPQVSSGADKHVDTHWAFLGFSNSLPLTDPKNVKCIQSIVDKPLSRSLTQLYGVVNVHHLSLARAELYTSLAQSLSPLHTTPVVSRTGVDQSTESSRPPTSASATPSVSTVQVGATTSPRSLTPSVFPSMTRRAKLQDIKHILLENAEKFLTAVCQNENSECLEFKISATLGMARVAQVYCQQSTAVHLSLAALRTMQINEDCYNPRLWLEAQLSLCHNLIGRKSAQSEILDCAAQCGSGVSQSEAMGDFELAAEFHYIAAVHCMSHIPQHLETVTDHCQKALELLERVPTLSPCSSLLRCQTSLLLADVSCVAGVTGMEKEMVEVFRGLVSMLKDQLGSEAETEDPNFYLPHRVILASCQLRLAHALCLGMRTDGGGADSALSACNEGLSLLKNSSQNDSCLLAELLVHQGWLLSISDEQAGISSLLEASKAIADCGIDPRLAVSTYYKLAELSTISGKQTMKSDNLFSSPSLQPSSPDKKCSRGDASRGSLRRRSTLNQSREQNSKPDREVTKERGRLSFCAWILLKLGSRAASTVEARQQFISQISNEEATRPLPQKVLADLPDFVVLDLCSTEELTNSLVCGVNVPSIKALLPSSQSVVTTRLNFFKIASYFNVLAEQCLWQKSLLSLSDSNWHLHYHSLTPIVYPKARALLNFLTAYSQHFKSVKIPIPPVSVFLTRAHQTASPQTPSSEPYITAGDTELTVIWTSPFSLDLGSGLIVGHFAMNAKAIRSQSASSNAMLGIDSYAVKMSVKALENVYKLWTELGEATKTYINTRASTRPVSRSPSKQKKSERALKVPQEIVDGCSQAVESLRECFDIHGTEVPQVDLSSVGQVAKLLEPYSQTTTRGDAYYFFKALFGSH